jgi:hypothetical protein
MYNHDYYRTNELIIFIIVFKLNINNVFLRFLNIKFTINLYSSVICLLVTIKYLCC